MKLDESLSIRIFAKQGGRLSGPEFFADSSRLELLGEKFLIDEGVVQGVQSFHEFAEIEVEVVAPVSYSNPVLNIGVKHIRFNRSISAGNPELIKYSFYDDSPFKNHLGFTNVSLYFEGGSIEQIEVPVEIYSSKATFDDARNMLTFIQEFDPEVANLCFSQSRLSAKSRNKSKVDLMRKIELGNQVIEFLHKQLALFKRDPCQVYRKERNQVTYNPERHHIDERTIQWLTRNSQEMSVDITNPHAHVDGLPVNISRVELHTPVYSTDVFENRVIHAFLLYHHQFLNMVGRLKSYEVEGRFDDEVYSFDELSIDWSRSLTGPQSVMRRGLRLLPRIKREFDRSIPASANKRVLPKATNEVKRKKHYSELFRLLHTYYEAGDPDWSDSSYLSGMKNLAKVYEIYTLTNLVSRMKRCGLELDRVFYKDDNGNEAVKPNDEPNNNYQFISKEGVNLTLLYEPKIHNYRNFNQGVHGIYKATYNSDAFGRDYLMPDFVVLNDNEFLILDSKFSTANSVDKYAIPKMMNRYGAGIHRETDDGVVLAKGVIAIYAKPGFNKNPKGIESLYSAPMSDVPLGDSGKVYLPPASTQSDTESAFNGVDAIIMGMAGYYLSTL